MSGVSRSAFPRRAGQGGFSMIEVLVSLVVLAIGLLGFALLQTMNLRYTQSANYRTQATNLAYDLLDQMRANRLSAAAYQAATFASGSQDGRACPWGMEETTVAQNVTRWKCLVAQSLGGDAAATVTYANGEAVVMITWGERLPGMDPTSQYVARTRL